VRDVEGWDGRDGGGKGVEGWGWEGCGGMGVGGVWRDVGGVWRGITVVGCERL